MKLYDKFKSEQKKKVKDYLHIDTVLVEDITKIKKPWCLEECYCLIYLS